MNFEQLKKDLDTTYIHVYPDGEKVNCEIQGNSLLLLSMVDQILTEIVEKKWRGLRSCDFLVEKNA